MKLALEDIRTDGGTQSRAAISASAVAGYAEAIRRGDTLPPVVVFHDGTHYWLADGFHRLAAFRDAGESEVPVEIRQGTVRDAILHSVGANTTHGVQRTNADKRCAVETLLRDEEWAQWSDNEIARRACVSHTFVAKARASCNGCKIAAAEPTRRKKAKRAGRQYTVNTQRIGRRAAAAEPLATVAPRRRRGRSPADEVPALDRLLLATSRAESEWKALSVGWSADKRLDMLFAEERVKTIGGAFDGVVRALATLREECTGPKEDKTNE